MFPHSLGALMKKLCWCFIAMFAGSSFGYADDDSLALESLQNAGAIVRLRDSQTEKSVKSVSLYLMATDDRVNSALKSLSSMSELSLTGIGGTELKPATLRALKSLTSLKRLSISLASISEESAQLLSKLNQLEELHFENQVEISTYSLMQVVQLPKLKELTLSDRLVTPEVLHELGKATSLQTLNLKSVFLKDEGVASLKRLKSLERLRIFVPSGVSDVAIDQLAQWPLSEVEVTCFDATDERLKRLRKFDHLVSLRLINARKVTDEAVAVLSELTELKRLDLSDSRISKSGLESLKRSLPNCEIKQLPVRQSLND